MQASTTVSVRAPPSSTKQGAISAAIVRVGDRLARELGLGEPASRGEPTSVTSQPWPKSRISAWVYSRVTVASVPSTETQLASARPRRPA